MVKCPFCSFDNEDGALFCEQCKSDLGAGPPVAMPMPAPEVVTAPLIAETVPLAAAAAPLAAAAAEIPVAAPVALAESPPAAPEAAPVVATLAAPEAAPPAAPAEEAPAAQPGTMPKLVVTRGLKIGIEYPLFPGENFIGRFDEKPVDIDLDDQEAPERTWSSRQHACIICDDSGAITIEDLNSSNGTFVNRARVFPGERRPLKANDTVQIGTVHMKVKA
jgi:hypothetical protein